MAFVVEDGTGLSTANCYFDIAFADEYFADSGRSVEWGADTALKQQAGIKATQYMDLIFGPRLQGNREKKSPMQALQMPRENMYDSDGELVEGIPLDWKKACCEYAIRALTSSLLPDPSSNTGTSTLKRKTEIVGPIETTIEYEGASTTLIRPYPLADLLVRPYLTLVASGRVIR